VTEIILVRHGETEWNRQEVFRGRLDVDLNDTGRRQAELLGEHLGKVKLDAVYSSPLKRALETADRIARHHRLEVQTAHGLIDFDYGEWQGLPKETVKTKYKGLYKRWLEKPHQVRIPGGESLDNVTERAIGVVNEVATRYQGRVVLVSHRVVNKVLICALLGLDNSRFWHIKQDTAGMTTFTYEHGRFILTEHNITAYLKPLGKVPLSDF
jgi:broad specificity phosphatase PhoE